MNPDNPLGTVETVIDGHRYEMQMMAATPARRLLLRILKVIGPTLGTMLDQILLNIRGKGDLTGRDVIQVLMGSGIDGKAASEMITLFVDRMSEAELDYVVAQMITLCSVGGQRMNPGSYEAHFTGRPWSAMKWLAWTIKAQYSPSLSDKSNDVLPVASSAGVPSPLPDNPSLVG